jgi:hypothetical protein
MHPNHIYDQVAEQLESQGHVPLASAVDTLNADDSEAARLNVALKLADTDLDLAMKVAFVEWGSINFLAKLAVAVGDFIRPYLKHVTSRDILGAIADHTEDLFKIIAPYIGADNSQEAVEKILKNAKFIGIITAILVALGLTSAIAYELYEKKGFYYLSKPLMAVIDAPLEGFKALFIKFLKFSGGWPVSGLLSLPVRKFELSQLKIWDKLQQRAESLFKHTGTEAPPERLLDVTVQLYWSPVSSIMGFFIDDSDTLWINLAACGKSFEDSKKIKSPQQLDRIIKSKPELGQIVAHEYTHFLQTATQMNRPSLGYLPALGGRLWSLGIAQAILHIPGANKVMSNIRVKIANMIAKGAVENFFYKLDLSEKQAFVEGFRYEAEARGSTHKTLEHWLIITAKHKFGIVKAKPFVKAIMKPDPKKAYEIVLRQEISVAPKTKMRRYIFLHTIGKLISKASLNIFTGMINASASLQVLLACADYMSKIPQGQQLTRKDMVAVERQVKKKVDKALRFDGAALKKHGDKVVAQELAKIKF